MTRPALPATQQHPAVEAKLSAFHRAVVDEVASTVTREPWVIVGMAQNPFVRKARRFLEAQGIAFTYLEYGSYLTQWKPRLALKLWAGYPTFPMVFRRGVLLGGYTDLVALERAGTLKETGDAGAEVRSA
jgi:glutaredoxin-related protein